SGNPPPPASVQNWSIVIQSGLVFGQQHTVTTTAVHGTQIEEGSGITPYPLASTAVPDIGIGPTPVIAADKTLGSFSPHEGRMYIAYSDLPRGPNLAALANNPGDNTDVFLTYSDDGGLTWSIPVQVNDDSA